MKRLSFFVLAFVFMFSFAAHASVSVGCLSKSNIDPEEFILYLSSGNLWSNLPGHSNNDTALFYDSIMSMMMALGSGEVDEIGLPGVVGAYVLNSRPDFKITCMVRMNKENLAFGFMKGRGESLRDKFNEAIQAIKADGTMRDIIARYMKVDGAPESIPFENFDGAETIKVAVTGDLPPIDYVATDGKAAGFNTALLAEIAKRLRVNVKTVYVNTASRTASLSSGRSDVVFWYQLTEGNEKHFDVPDSVIVSEPYFDWTTFLHIGLKHRYND